MLLLKPYKCLTYLTNAFTLGKTTFFYPYHIQTLKHKQQNKKGRLYKLTQNIKIQRETTYIHKVNKTLNTNPNKFPYKIYKIYQKTKQILHKKRKDILKKL